MPIFTKRVTALVVLLAAFQSPSAQAWCAKPCRVCVDASGPAKPPPTPAPKSKSPPEEGIAAPRLADADAAIPASDPDLDSRIAYWKKVLNQSDAQVQKIDQTVTVDGRQVHIQVIVTGGGSGPTPPVGPVQPPAAGDFQVAYDLDRKSGATDKELQAYIKSIGQAVDDLPTLKKEADVGQHVGMHMGENLPGVVVPHLQHVLVQVHSFLQSQDRALDPPPGGANRDLDDPLKATYKKAYSDLLTKLGQINSK